MTYQPQNLNSQTGVLYGCITTINGGDNTLFDVGSGKISIVDWTGVSGNLGKPRSQVLTYPGDIGVAPVSGVANVFTGLFLTESTSAGIAQLEQVEQSILEFTNETRRDKVALQAPLHVLPSGGILAITDDYQLGYEWEQQLNDYIHDVGVTSNGNRYSAGVSGNFVDRAAGNGARLHFNAANDTKNPTSRSSSAETSAGWSYTKQVSGGGSGEFVSGGQVNIVDPDQFDNAGTLTDVAVNNFTIQTFFFFPQSSTTSVAYGQTTFGSLGAAEASISDGSFDDSFIIPPNTINGVRITYLIVREGTTDLNDAGDAKFIQHRNAIIQELGT